jgi:hypothetical protein
LDLHPGVAVNRRAEDNGAGRTDAAIAEVPL